MDELRKLFTDKYTGQGLFFRAERMAMAVGGAANVEIRARMLLDMKDFSQKMERARKRNERYERKVEENEGIDREDGGKGDCGRCGYGRRDSAAIKSSRRLISNQQIIGSKSDIRRNG
ncbi:hypothetical protein P7H17_27085 [Paenibacillus larvae]|nr:hypothetical protein [Paenibacillus larvae]MDT2288998.1 hypothetical protein [Paenibacillus larvae]